MNSSFILFLNPSQLNISCHFLHDRIFYLFFSLNIVNDFIQIECF